MEHLTLYSTLSQKAFNSITHTWIFNYFNQLKLIKKNKSKGSLMRYEGHYLSAPAARRVVDEDLLVPINTSLIFALHFGNIMAPLELKPRTFCIQNRCDDHYTMEPASLQFLYLVLSACKTYTTGNHWRDNLSVGTGAWISWDWLQFPQKLQQKSSIERKLLMMFLQS